MVLVSFWIDDEKAKRVHTQLIFGNVMYRIMEVSELGKPCALKNQRRVHVSMRGHYKGQHAHQV
jgi:hypothetical protein